MNCHKTLRPQTNEQRDGPWWFGVGPAACLHLHFKCSEHVRNENGFEQRCLKMDSIAAVMSANRGGLWRKLHRGFRKWNDSAVFFYSHLLQWKRIIYLGDLGEKLTDKATGRKLTTDNPFKYRQQELHWQSRVLLCRPICHFAQMFPEIYGP